MTGQSLNFYENLAERYQCDGIIPHSQLRCFRNHDGEEYQNYNEIDIRKRESESFLHFIISFFKFHTIQREMCIVLLTVTD